MVLSLHIKMPCIIIIYMYMLVWSRICCKRVWLKCMCVVWLQRMHVHQVRRVIEGFVHKVMCKIWCTTSDNKYYVIINFVCGTYININFKLHIVDDIIMYWALAQARLNVQIGWMQYDCLQLMFVLGCTSIHASLIAYLILGLANRHVSLTPTQI